MWKMTGMVLVWCSLASANLITNGSFENGNFSGGNFTRVAAGQTNLTGWTVQGIAVDWHNTNDFGPMQNGTRGVDLNLDGGSSGTGVLQQSFNSTIGSTYLLRFFAAAPTVTGLGTRSMRAFAGFSNSIDITLTNSPQRSLVWTEYSLQFTAVGSSTNIGFASLNGAAFWGPVIDSVSVEEVGAGVPEGNSAFLLAGGLLGLLFRRKQ